MSKVIEPPRLPGGTSQELKSQIALELLLNVYAIVGALVLLRTLLLTIGVDDQLWLGSTIYRLSDPIIKPLTLLPGSTLVVFHSLTVADLTLLAGVVLFPLGIYARGTSRNQPG
jgi:hypothetical protein